MTTQHKAPKYEFLDGLRGIAALQVVFLHYYAAFLPAFARAGVAEHYKWETLATNSPAFLLVQGYVAVYVFFIMSGFVLANSFLDRGCIGSKAVRPLVPSRPGISSAGRCSDVHVQVSQAASGRHIDVIVAASTMGSAARPPFAHEGRHRQFDDRRVWSSLGVLRLSHFHFIRIADPHGRRSQPASLDVASGILGIHGSPYHHDSHSEVARVVDVGRNAHAFRLLRHQLPDAVPVWLCVLSDQPIEPADNLSCSLDHRSNFVVCRMSSRVHANDRHHTGGTRTHPKSADHARARSIPTPM